MTDERVYVGVSNCERLLQRALTFFIESTDDLTVVELTTQPNTEMTSHTTRGPDVLVLGFSQDSTGVDDHVERVRKSHSSARILAVVAEDASTVSALQAGATGVVVRDSEPSTLLNRIREVHRGETVLHQSALRYLVEHVRNASCPQGRRRPIDADLQDLTEGELRVVEQLAKGMSNLEIAHSLFLSEATIKMRLGRVMAKWGAPSRVHVLIQALSGGIVDLGSLSPRAVSPELAPERNT